MGFALALTLLGAGFAWAALNFAAAAMHPAPSQTNFVFHIAAGGLVGVIGFVGLLIEMWSYFS